MPTSDEAASWRAYVEKAKLIDRAGGMTVLFVPQKEPDAKAAPRDQPADRLRKLIDSAGLQIKVLNADSGSLFAVTSRDRKTDPLLIARLEGSRDAGRQGWCSTDAVCVCRPFSRESPPGLSSIRNPVLEIYRSGQASLAMYQTINGHSRRPLLIRSVRAAGSDLIEFGAPEPAARNGRGNGRRGSELD